MAGRGARAAGRADAAHRGAYGHTAPPVPTTSVVPLIRCAGLRCTQVIEARFASTGKVCAHSRYRRMRLRGPLLDHLLLFPFVPSKSDGRASWPRRQIYSCPQHSHCRAQIQCGASCSTVLTASLLRAFRSGPSWTISRTDAAHEVGHGVANLVGAILLEEMAPFHRHFGLVQPGAAKFPLPAD